MQINIYGIPGAAEPIGGERWHVKLEGQVIVIFPTGTDSDHLLWVQEEGPGRDDIQAIGEAIEKAGM